MEREVFGERASSHGSANRRCPPQLADSLHARRNSVLLQCELLPSGDSCGGQLGSSRTVCELTFLMKRDPYGHSKSTCMDPEFHTTLSREDASWPPSSTSRVRLPAGLRTAYRYDCKAIPRRAERSSTGKTPSGGRVSSSLPFSRGGISRTPAPSGSVLYPSRSGTAKISWPMHRSQGRRTPNVISNGGWPDWAILASLRSRRIASRRLGTPWHCSLLVAAGYASPGAGEGYCHPLTSGRALL